MVSIIITTYNNSAFVLEAVYSVLNQQYKNIECIIIDDGSTDDTLKALNPLIKDNLINYIYQENVGVCSARNHGIRVSKGDFLMFLDADDLLTDDAVSFLMNNVAENDIIFGAWKDFSQNSSHVNLYHQYKGSDLLVKYLVHKPTISTAIIKKTCILPWDETLKVWEVTDYFLNLILSNVKFNFYNKIVTEIRQHSDKSRVSIMQNHFNPLLTLSFLKRWKQYIQNANQLNYEVEAAIDTEIINNIYTALRNKTSADLLKPFFSLINTKNLKNAQSYKKLGLLFFVHHLKTFESILIFKKLNKFLKRI